MKKISLLSMAIAFCASQTIDSSEDQPADFFNISSPDTKFYLHTPPPDNQTIEITSNNYQDFINSSKPLKIIIHGTGVYRELFCIDEMVTVYHQQGNYTIVVVDWSVISTRDTIYVGSAVNATGYKVADFILKIVENNVDILENVHLIGYSYGAQVGAIAGEKIEKDSTRKIGRITGLEPQVNAERDNLTLLDPSDATFVDVIHVGLFGEAYGTVDFFIDVANNSYNISSHDSPLIVYEYFIHTIQDKDSLEGVQCVNGSVNEDDFCKNGSRVKMGESVPRNASGSYYVKTDLYRSCAYTFLFTDNILLIILGILVPFFNNKIKF